MPRCLSYGKGMNTVPPKLPVIVIAGPTAVGKTDAAIQLGLLLARESLGFQIVNFDSLCFYSELSVGTARPSVAQMQGLPHALMGHGSIREPLNAARFCEQALPLIESLHKKRQIPILVGGSAFYLRALVKGMYASANLALREENGVCGRDYLKIFDPVSWRGIHPNDHYRINRAVEYHRQTGMPISSQKREFEGANPYDFSRPRVSQWQVLTLYLDIPKEAHWKIIRQRTERMLKNGLIEETRDLLARGFTGLEKPLQSVGYKEVQDYLQGRPAGLGPLSERIFLSTRQLAKSQRTFFKKIHPKICFNPLVERDRALGDMAHKMSSWNWG